MMRDYLIERDVPADRILLEPHARHTTTNLRNAGRIMRALGLETGLLPGASLGPVMEGLDDLSRRERQTLERFLDGEDIEQIAAACLRRMHDAT